MPETTSEDSLLQTEKTLLEPENARDRHLFGPGPKRVLSFDGGGVRGAITVAFLERIEAIFAAHQRKVLTEYIDAREQQARDGRRIDERKLVIAREKLSAPVCLADWFDLVGGTSTGALIAGAVALGFSTENIKEFYTERAQFIFRRPFWRIPGLQAKFDARALRQEIDKIVKDRKLDSDDLLTGLSVVAKRIDTGSPWVLTNNSRSPYWADKEPDPETGEGGHIGNRHFKLGTLVRASTAAPHFFDPEIVQILADSKPTEASVAVDEEGFLSRLNDKLGRFPRLTMLLTKLRARLIAGAAKGSDPATQAANKLTHGLFVDGGVTPYNNPSLALLMQIVLKPYGLCWELGPDKLTFVSIGTGSYRTIVSFEELGWSRNVKLALNSLLSMMGDTQTLALTQMQWLGECPDPWEINSEVGTLASEVPPGRRWFRFMRYDLGLEEKWFKKHMGLDLPKEVVASYRDMDKPAIIPIIYEHAVEAARRQVKVEHFFPDQTSSAGDKEAGAAQTGSA